MSSVEPQQNNVHVSCPGVTLSFHFPVRLVATNLGFYITGCLLEKTSSFLKALFKVFHWISNHIQVKEVFAHMFKRNTFHLLQFDKGTYNFL